MGLLWNNVTSQFMGLPQRDLRLQDSVKPDGCVGGRAFKYLCYRLLLSIAFVSVAKAETDQVKVPVADAAPQQEGLKNETESAKASVTDAPSSEKNVTEDALKKVTNASQKTASPVEQRESSHLRKFEETRIQGDLGLEVILASGLNVCVPRGGATCNDILPGMMGRAALQYRFWHLGIGLNYRVGNYFPVGTGSEDLTIRTRHAIFEFLGFLPRYRTVEPFVGFGLGYGTIESRDARSNSEVAWRSLWESFSGRFGIRGKPGEVWALGSSMIWELNATILTHQGGERCVLFAGQGACRPSNELDTNQTDYASTFGLEAAIGWSF